MQLSIRLGKTYRRMPGNDHKNLEARDRQARGSALGSNPGNLEETRDQRGSRDAYLDARQEAKAATLADKMIGGAGFASAPADARAARCS